MSQASADPPQPTASAARPAARLRGEIVTIGDELNRGEIIDSNAAWLGEQLTDLGVHVRYRQGVNDQPDDIAAALQLAAGRAEVVVVSGGLGPTSDDLTVDVAARLCGVEPVLDPEHELRMRERFTERKLPLSPNNLRQVRVPAGATVHPNRHGLAPGFQIGLGGARLFFLPGVPREQRPMFTSEVAPAIQELVGGGFAARRRLYRVLGLGESHVDHRLSGLSDLLKGLPPGSGAVTVHYRLAFPEVLVTLVAEGVDGVAAQATLDLLHPEVVRRLGRALYNEGPDELPLVVGRALRERGATLAVAESCTGGLIGQLVTAAPGSSAYFTGGVIAYDNAVKQRLLQVRLETLVDHGAVSEACVREMAAGARRLLGTTYAIAVSGVAGPDGGTPEKPVGTVHIAVAGPGPSEAGGQGDQGGPDVILHRHVLWPGDREQVRRVAAMAALNLLHKALHPERLSDASLRL